MRSAGAVGGGKCRSTQLLVTANDGRRAFVQGQEPSDITARPSGLGKYTGREDWNVFSVCSRHQQRKPHPLLARTKFQGCLRALSTCRSTHCKWASNSAHPAVRPWGSRPGPHPGAALHLRIGEGKANYCRCGVSKKELCKTCLSSVSPKMV